MSEGESTGRVKVSHTCRKWSVFGELADSTEDELAARRSLLSADPPTGSAGQRARPSGRNRICIHLCVRQPMRTVVVVVIVISPLVIIAGSSPSSGSGRSAARTGLRRVAAAVRRNCNLAPPPPLESPLSHAVMCARASWLACPSVRLCVTLAPALTARRASVRLSAGRAGAVRSALRTCARAPPHTGAHNKRVPPPQCRSAETVAVIATAPDFGRPQQTRSGRPRTREYPEQWRVAGSKC